MLKILHQSIDLPAAPAQLYAMYLDPEVHAGFTGGGPVTIGATPGTEWSAFDGRIHGRILALTPGRQIVQSWRSFEWQEPDPDSVLVLGFSGSPGGSTIDLVQVAAPERLYDTLSAGWPTRYWQPWRRYLEGLG